MSTFARRRFGSACGDGRALFPPEVIAGAPLAGVGSVLPLPELLSKLLRDGRADELAELGALLGPLDLRPVDAATARLAAALAADHALAAIGAVHLATAVNAGADRFITNDSRDFPRHITEIRITYPNELPDSWSPPADA